MLLIRRYFERVSFNQANWLGLVILTISLLMGCGGSGGDSNPNGGRDTPDPGGNGGGTVPSKLSYRADVQLNSASYPSRLVELGGVYYFQAKSTDYGVELWRTDGTATGTRMVKDINPGTADSNPKWLTVVGNTLYFTATTQTTSTKLWMSDGSSAGTKLVSSIPNAYTGSDPRNLTASNDTLYYRATRNTKGNELWEANIASGTFNVVNLNTDSSSSNVTNFIMVGKSIYYTTYTSSVRKLWRHVPADGTTRATTKLIKRNIDTYNLTAMGNSLYFVAAIDGFNDNELWKSNGTAATTFVVKDINPGANGSKPENLVAIGNTLYFEATDGVNGYELWKTDGATLKTSMVADINFGDLSSSPSRLFAVGNTLYFVADTKEYGYELWKTDGTAGNTIMVSDIFPGTGSSTPGSFAALGDTLYFSAKDESLDSALWSSKGSQADTNKVIQVNNNPDMASYLFGLIALNGTLYFTANDGAHDMELWKSDGSSEGTEMVADINIGKDFVTTDDALYFLARAGDIFDGEDLWKTTAKSLYHTTNISTSSNASFYRPKSLYGFANMLYFSASGGGDGQELWKTDGTYWSAKEVDNIFYSGSSIPHNFATLGNILFFAANARDVGVELWKSKGSASSTTMVDDIFVGTDSSNPRGLTSTDTRLFFVATSRLNAYYTDDQLHIVNDTLTGSLKISGSDGTNIINPSELTAVGNTLYFSGKDYDFGTELWKSDGTNAGTMIVREIMTGITSTSPYSLRAIGDTLFFVVDPKDATNLDTRQLWKSDGSFDGTTKVVDFNFKPGQPGSTKPDFTVVGPDLYFINTTANGFSEIWVADGITGETRTVLDSSRAVTINRSTLIESGNLLFFTAADDQFGEELWQSDGTVAGTKMAIDINPGPDSSSPFQLTSLNGQVYFVTNESKLYKYQP